MHRRTRLAAIMAAALVLVAAACTTPPPPTGATYKNGRCAGTEGVTVVVDLDPLDDEVIVRCALGAQQSGFSVLDDADIDHDPGNFPGTVCQIEGLPTQGHPFCWTTGGFWSYWKAPAAGSPWAYSEFGAGSGPAPAPGSVEGWRFAPFSAGDAQPPRVGTFGPIVP
jgi:hypothetical protein